MKYIIGMDGGGTKTRSIIAAEDGKKLYECTGGASNFLVTGMNKACRNIFLLIKECINKLKIRYDDIEIFVLGTAGAGRKKDVQKFESAFRKLLKDKKVRLKKFLVESDAKIALEAAFVGKPGCILIAGTGSICMGKDSAGNILRVGGFGRYIGDEGSGYSLGRKLLIAAAKEYDGREASAIITRLLKEKFKIKSAEDLIDQVYNKGFDLSSAAPLLLEAAGLNDPAALKIIDEETEELHTHIKAMHAKIKEPVLNLALTGSLLTSENIYSEKLKEKIKELPYLVLRDPENEPAMGAVLLAVSFLKQKPHPHVKKS